ncbi:MAG TPA: glycosyltransferase family 39 protein, partial [Candidatus Woesebacteria bacterium]|nr:glycosyltransferase family 39 protein [Candidatus Woesebacteria bacterium]
MVERRSFYLAQDARWVWPDVGQLNGHTISGRSPGESFLGIPFYLIATRLKQFIVVPYGGSREGIDQYSGIKAATSIGVAFFGGLSVVMVIYLAGFFAKQPLAQIGAGLSFGLGTLIWKYSTTFYRHSYHTFFILLATYGLFSGMTRNKSRWWSSFLIGIGSGGALLVEPTSVIFVVVCLALWIYVLLKQRKLTIGNMLKHIGGLVLLIGFINLPMFYYNLVLFGPFYKT